MFFSWTNEPIQPNLTQTILRESRFYKWGKLNSQKWILINGFFSPNERYDNYIDGYAQMFLLVWTVIKGERCGPWVACYNSNLVFPMLMLNCVSSSHPLIVKKDNVRTFRFPHHQTSNYVKFTFSQSSTKPC